VETFSGWFLLRWNNFQGEILANIGFRRKDFQGNEGYFWVKMGFEGGFEEETFSGLRRKDFRVK